MASFLPVPVSIGCSVVWGRGLRFTKKGRQTAPPELVRDLVLDNPAPFVRFDHHQAPQGSQTWFSTPAR
jgi:hypothetical protein